MHSSSGTYCNFQTRETPRETCTSPTPSRRSRITTPWKPWPTRWRTTGGQGRSRASARVHNTLTRSTTTWACPQSWRKPQVRKCKIYNTKWTMFWLQWLFQIENEGKPESVLTSLFETLTGFVWLTYFLTNLGVPWKRKQVLKGDQSFDIFYRGPGQRTEEPHHNDGLWGSRRTETVKKWHNEEVIIQERLNSKWNTVTNLETLKPV